MSNTEIVTVTRNYQVTIPSRIRRVFRVREGDKVKIYVADNKIVIERVEDDLPQIELKDASPPTRKEIHDAIISALEAKGW